jgi:hypothetical protein
VPADATSDELLDEVLDAIRSLGVDAVSTEDGLEIDGVGVCLDAIGRAHPHPAELRDLVASPRPTDAVPVVVADRVSDAGREVLRPAGWGFLDRRGWLRLWTVGLRVDTAVATRPRARAADADPWTGVGLEVALWALCHPSETMTARRVAGAIGRSPSYVHELIARFAELGLIGARSHRPLLPDLFWETAARWPDDGWVASGLDPDALADVVDASQLVRVDERAATLGGARIAAAGDLPARFYVASGPALRRMRNQRPQEDEPRRTLVRAAPVRWLPDLEDVPPTDDHPWRVAHPIVCALRLAADPSRGREIVDQWGIVPTGEAA